MVKVIDRSQRVVYEPEDLSGTQIDVQFFQEELVPVRITSRTSYKIDEILDKRVRRGNGKSSSAGKVTVRSFKSGAMQQA